MRIRNYLLLHLLSVTLVTGVVFNSCTRKEADYLGPEYLSAPADFSASNLVVTPSIDFSSGVCNITADFSARVTYYVTITGLTSGAQKVYTGVGSNITASSVGGTWNGSHDGLYFFRSGESVKVKLTFLRSAYSIEQTVNLVTARDYFENPNYIPLSTTSNYSYESAGAFPTQFTFSEALAGPDKFAGRALAATYGVKAIHGDYILRISGKSQQADGFFVGGAQHRASGTPATGFMLPATWTDPTQIYFNVYVYGTGADSAKATVNLEFHESDASNPSNTASKSECGGTIVGEYGHDPCTDDGWVYAMPINFTGWRLVSVKYSDFIRSVSVPNGGSGDGVKEPNRVARIQLGVVSTPAFQTARVIFDHAVISYGAPFDPTN